MEAGRKTPDYVIPDDVPKVRDFLASGLAVEVKDDRGVTYIRTDPIVHTIINQALAAKGKAARAVQA